MEKKISTLFKEAFAVVVEILSSEIPVSYKDSPHYTPAGSSQIGSQKMAKIMLR